MTPQHISGLKREDFQTVVQGKETDLYTLVNNNGMEVDITNYGGALVSIMVPDRNGKYANVIPCGLQTTAWYIRLMQWL